MEPRLLLSVFSALTGVGLCGGALFLIARQRVIRGRGGASVELQIPLFGQLKTNYPAALALFLGGFLLYYPLSRWPEAGAKLPISGRITIEGRSSHEGVMVGIVAGGQMTITRSDGSFELRVPEGETAYTGLALYTDGTTKDVYLGPVDLDEGSGKFDAVVRRWSGSP
jgi:hypothetical protein